MHKVGYTWQTVLLVKDEPWKTPGRTTDQREATGRLSHFNNKELQWDFGFGPMFHDIGRTFNATYRCYSVTMYGDREDVERGGKIIMPPSALDQLTRLHIQYPMLFKLTNKKIKRESHCGVLEFVADEGRIYIPYWMMKNLVLQEGDLVQVDNVSLPVATFAKFQPQSVDFLDITNPKAVLENALRSFACLTTDDMIEFKYNERLYELRVLETKPGKAVSIIECDMNPWYRWSIDLIASLGLGDAAGQFMEWFVDDCFSMTQRWIQVDFAPSVGYKEPDPQHREEHHETEPMDQAEATETGFIPFACQGNRLDGKKKGADTSPVQLPNATPRRGVPNYHFKKGTITFIRTPRPTVSNGNTEDKSKVFEAFSGEGQSLRKTKGRK